MSLSLEFPSYQPYPQQICYSASPCADDIDVSLTEWGIWLAYYQGVLCGGGWTKHEALEKALDCLKAVSPSSLDDSDEEETRLKSDR